MSNSKKNREVAKRRSKPEQQRRRPQAAPIDARFVKPDIHREVRYITQLAQAEESRVVKLANLVLFSTQTRDAWLLDAEDSYAMCLCRDGEAQPFRIIDTPDSFAIEWTARFAIAGDAFVVLGQSGTVVEMHGYPVGEVAAACRN